MLQKLATGNSHAVELLLPHSSCQSLVRLFLFILITAGLLYSLYLLHRGEQKFCISLINSKDIFSSLTLFPLEEGSERKNTCWPNDQHLPLLKTNELACHLKSTYLAIWCHWHVCTLWRSIITLRNDLLFWVIPRGAQCLQNIQTLAKQIYCQYLSFFFLQNLFQNWHQII